MNRDDSRLGSRMRAFHLWRAELEKALQDYLAWLDERGMGDPETELRFHDTVQALHSDRLTIAFLAEVSRGKSELINAIFFADYGRRLVPSRAGRTTMCPTEFFYDHEEDRAYICLLPIETRAQEVSIADYKHDLIHWNRTYLDTEDPEQLAEALGQIVETKELRVDEAVRLGLFDEQEHAEAHGGEILARVEVPKWRHALVSFPHPLLKEGLTILDTPGLNALGAEPELTFTMLPSAHAVIFLLAADTGVTRSDLQLWREHVKPLYSGARRGVVIALNKIDTLWDQITRHESIDADIDMQRNETAAVLDVDPGRVFPVSAQKALVAKIKQDRALTESSRIAELEAYLATYILPQKQAIIRERLLNEAGGHIDRTRATILSRLKHSRAQLQQLHSLIGKNTDVVQRLLRKCHQERADYMKNVERFRTSRRLLDKQARLMLEALSLDAVDHLVTRTRKEMAGSWTTMGLKKGMKGFYEDARDTLNMVNDRSQQMLKLIRGIYKNFHEHHDFPEMDPTPFSVEKYNAEFERLYADAERFRNSPVTTMTEQHFVVKKFFISLVSHARNIFFNANNDFSRWNRQAIEPLETHIAEYRDRLERQMNDLKKFSNSRGAIKKKIETLTRQCSALEEELAQLNSIRGTLFAPAPFEVLPHRADQADSGDVAS